MSYKWLHGSWIITRGEKFDYPDDSSYPLCFQSRPGGSRRSNCRSDEIPFVRNIRGVLENYNIVPRRSESRDWDEFSDFRNRFFERGELEILKGFPNERDCWLWIAGVDHQRLDEFRRPIRTIAAIQGETVELQDIYELLSQSKDHRARAIASMFMDAANVENNRGCLPPATQVCRLLNDFLGIHDESHFCGDPKDKALHQERLPSAYDADETQRKADGFKPRPDNGQPSFARREALFIAMFVLTGIGITFSALNRLQLIRLQDSYEKVSMEAEKLERQLEINLQHSRELKERLQELELRIASRQQQNQSLSPVVNE